MLYRSTAGLRGRAALIAGRRFTLHSSMAATPKSPEAPPAQGAVIPAARAERLGAWLIAAPDTMQCHAGAPRGGLSLDPSKYPAVRRDDSVVEDLHGVKARTCTAWTASPASSPPVMGGSPSPQPARRSLTPTAGLKTPTRPRPAHVGAGWDRSGFMGREQEGVLGSKGWGAAPDTSPEPTHAPRFPWASVVEAQNAVTSQVLDQCETRDQFK